MTISVSGVDILRSVEGRKVISTAAWMATGDSIAYGFIGYSLGDALIRMPIPSPYKEMLMGTTRESLVAKARTVALLQRSTMRLARLTTSSAVDGSYTFTGLKPAPELYVAVELDDIATLPDFDAIAHDKLTAGH